MVLVDSEVLVDLEDLEPVVLVVLMDLVDLVVLVVHPDLDQAQLMELLLRVDSVVQELEVLEVLVVQEPEVLEVLVVQELEVLEPEVLSGLVVSEVTKALVLEDCLELVDSVDLLLEVGFLQLLLNKLMPMELTFIECNFKFGNMVLIRDPHGIK